MGSCCSVEPVDVEPGPYPTSDTASLHSDVGGEETWRAKGLKRSPALSDIASRSEQRRPSRGDAHGSVALRVAIPNLVSEQEVLSPPSASKPAVRGAAAKVSPSLSDALPRGCLWRARPCRGLPCRAPLCPVPFHSFLR